MMNTMLLVTSISFLIAAASIASWIGVHFAFKFGSTTIDKRLLGRLVQGICTPFAHSTVFMMLYGGATYFFNPIQGMEFSSEVLALFLGLVLSLRFIEGLRLIHIFSPSRGEDNFNAFIGEARVDEVMKLILSTVYNECYVKQANPERQTEIGEYLAKTTLSS